MRAGDLHIRQQRGDGLGRCRRPAVGMDNVRMPCDVEDFLHHSSAGCADSWAWEVVPTMYGVDIDHQAAIAIGVLDRAGQLGDVPGMDPSSVPWRPVPVSCCRVRG